MAEILRRKSLELDPEYPPGNAYSIDLPRPGLVPPPAPAPSPMAFPPGFDLLSDAPKFLAPSPLNGIPQRMSVQAPQPVARPQMTPAPMPTPAQVQGLRRSGGIAKPQASAPPVVTPPRVGRPAAQPAAAPIPQFAFPAQGPRLQGYRAGSPQALAAGQAINNPGFIPQAGSGLIVSSNGNAYSIRPPNQQEVAAQAPPQDNYRPRTLGGLAAGLAIQQLASNNQMRQQKFAMQQKADAERSARDAQRLGIEQQNANTNAARLDQERYQIFSEEVASPDGLSTIKVPMRLNTKTGEVSPVKQRTGPSFDEFKAGVAGVPAFKGRSDAELMDYWKRTHGGQ